MEKALFLAENGLRIGNSCIPTTASKRRGICNLLTHRITNHIAKKCLK